jgi:hypothetical protein
VFILSPFVSLWRAQRLAAGTHSTRESWERDPGVGGAIAVPELGRSAVCRRDGGNDCKPEAASFAGRMSTVCKGLERASCQRRGKSVSLVGDVQLHHVLVLSGLELNNATAVAKRIVDEVRERLFESQLIAFNHESRVLDRDSPAAFACAQLESRRDPGQQLVCVEPFRPDW